MTFPFSDFLEVYHGYFNYEENEYNEHHGV